MRSAPSADSSLPGVAHQQHRQPRCENLRHQRNWAALPPEPCIIQHPRNAGLMAGPQISSGNGVHRRWATGQVAMARGDCLGAARPITASVPWPLITGNGKAAAAAARPFESLLSCLRSGGSKAATPSEGSGSAAGRYPRCNALHSDPRSGFHAGRSTGRVFSSRAPLPGLKSVCSSSAEFLEHLADGPALTEAAQARSIGLAKQGGCAAGWNRGRATAVIEQFEATPPVRVRMRRDPDIPGLQLAQVRQSREE